LSAATARKPASRSNRRAPATVQASLAWSRAPPGDRKPEQTLCRLRRRDNQTLCRLRRRDNQTLCRLRRRESQQAGAIVAHLQRCKHRLRGAGLRPATVSRSRRCVGCDGAIISRMALRA
jgi:hypothetical protein